MMCYVAVAANQTNTHLIFNYSDGVIWQDQRWWFPAAAFEC